MKIISFSGNYSYKIIVLVIITLLSVVVDTSAKVIDAEYMQSKKISVNIKNQPLTTLFKQIENKSEFVFLYSKSDIDPNIRITIEMKDVSVDAILARALANSNLDYSINNRQISIIKSTKRIYPAKNISGTISDTQGNPMTGALVAVKGSLTSGAISDMEGYFSLQATDNDILVFSFLGYKTQEIPVRQHRTFNIVLEEDMQAVGEVVIVGFGSQKKINLTGSVATVNSEAFKERPLQNASQALQGMAAGLNVTSTAGGIGSKPKLNIRGETTIGLGSNGDPLILIDGMEGDINTINPQDIESISVLKDAAASSIYGSRAPFGVILVTTKSGKAGRVTINYNNSFRFSNASNTPHMVNSWRFANYLNEGLANDGKAYKFTDDALDRMKRYIEGSLTSKNIPDPTNPSVWAIPKFNANDNVNWFDAMFGGSTFSQEHTVSITGGTEKLQVYASMNYLDQDGLLQIADDKYKRYATNLKITGDINSYLKFNYNIKFNREDFNRPAFFDNITVYRSFSQTFPNMPLTDDNGYYYEDDYRMPSALSIADGGTYKSNNNNVYQQFKLTATPLKNWNINAEVNFRMNIYNEHTDNQLFYNRGVDGITLIAPKFTLTQSSVNELNKQFNYLNPNIYSDYSLSLAEAHNFKLMLGFQAERQWNKSISANRAGIIVPYMDQIDVTDGRNAAGVVVPPTVGGMTEDWATAGFFGRLNYDYKGRYLAEVNLRYDGTSRYRSDKRWNWFPSFSVGWNLAQEHLWKNFTDVCNMLKFRASYGELGNQNTTTLYPTYQTLTISPASGGYIFNNLKPTIVSSPALLNSSMTWETIKTFDIGLDFGFLSNRLTGSFDYYKRTTADMIGPGQELPNILGKPVPNENNTELKSYGWELSIKWQDRLSNGLGYSAGFLLYDAQSKITKYPNPGTTLDLLSRNGASVGGIPLRFYEGEKTGEIWGYQTIGIAKTQEEMDRHLATLPNGGQDALGRNFGAGDIMYADLNNDGKISSGSISAKKPGDMKILGNQTPRYNFGIDLGADYKGFDLRVFLQGTMKRDFATSDVLFFGAQGNEAAFITETHMDYFRGDANHPFGQNLNAYYPRPIVDSENPKNARVQSRYVLNAAYLRLKNLQIGYTIPDRITNKYGINRLRIFFSGENLLTATKLPNMYDPETISLGGTRKDNQPGISSNEDILGAAYPILRTYSFGISITL